MNHGAVQLRSVPRQRSQLSTVKAAQWQQGGAAVPSESVPGVPSSSIGERPRPRIGSVCCRHRGGENTAGKLVGAGNLREQLHRPVGPRDRGRKRPKRPIARGDNDTVLSARHRRRCSTGIDRD